MQLLDRGIQEEGLKYNMHKILVVEKHFGISIAPVRSRGESLVNYNLKWR
jgi:hypothetical protein